MAKQIVVDPGHGGHDPGAQSGGHKEKDLALIYGKAIRDALKEIGYPVVMTRDTDIFIALGERAAIANRLGARAFISVHFNAASAAAANGLWVIHDDDTKPEAGVSLAHAIFRRLDLIEGITDSDPEVEVYADKTGWVAGRELTVVSESNMPAVLLELGFLTNKLDREQLIAPEVIKEVARGVALGLSDWHAGRFPASTPAVVPAQPTPLPTPSLTPVSFIEMDAREVVEPGQSVRDVLRDVVSVGIQADDDDGNSVLEAVREDLERVLDTPWIISRLPKWIPMSLIKWVLDKLLTRAGASAEARVGEFRPY